MTECITIANQTSSSKESCPFCETAVCPECHGCSGECNSWHACECWEIKDEHGHVTDRIPSRRCAGCGFRAPEIFLSAGICPDCQGTAAREEVAAGW